MEPTSKAFAIALNHTLAAPPPFEISRYSALQWLTFALGSMKAYFELSILAVE